MNHVDIPAQVLQPIIDAIVRSLREEDRLSGREISVTLPALDGHTIIVSLRSAQSGLDNRRLRRVIGTINEKIDGPISVSDLSNVAGLSRSHFSHAFRAAVGRTPHAHVVRLRVERAMQLMRETDDSLSAIALASGFSDQAHFSNRFRRIVGTTPSAWRRAHRCDPYKGSHSDAILAASAPV